MTDSAPWTRVFILLALLPLTGCRGHSGPDKEEQHPAPVKAKAIAKVKMGEWTDLLGVSQPLPRHSAKITAVVEGRVIHVLGDRKGSLVREGQDVNAGQVIVQLDDRVPRANGAKLHAVSDELGEQKKQAEFALKLTEIDVKRLKDLLVSSGTPGSVPLPAVSQIELEKADVLNKDAKSKVLAMAAKQAAAQADLKAHEEQLDFYTLRAPIKGKLGIVQIVPGQTLTPGAVVAEVIDLSEIDVLCYAPPAAASRMELGQEAKLVNELAPADDPGHHLSGKVVYVGVQAQAETGNVAVKVRFPNPGLRMRANAIVRVLVLTRPEMPREAIPDTALIEDLDAPMVLAVQDVKTEKKEHDHEVEEMTTGKIRKLRAVVGVRDREQGLVEIHLEDPATGKAVEPEGLLFVTAGGQGLQDGDVVKIEKEENKENK